MNTKELFTEIGEKYLDNFKCDKMRNWGFNKLIELKEGNVRISSCANDIRTFNEDMEVVGYCFNSFGCVFITKTRKYMAWTLRANVMATIRNNGGWIAEGTEDKIKAIVMLGKISK
jgi:hypothetical protein